MHRPRRRWIVAGAVVAILLAVPVVAWVSLTYQPRFYRRAKAQVSRAELEAESRRFMAQTSHLYNDIRNEPTWTALFTDQEVNAWLAKDLVEQFADQIPPEVHDPRVAFEPDRVTLAFGLDRGPIRLVVAVTARVRVPEDNLIALTVEKIRAGAFPLDSQSLIDRITDHARRRGLDLRWERDAEGLPVALIHYQAQPGRTDVVLERLMLADGRIVLAGRSRKGRGAVASPRLPDRRTLQSTFRHMRKVHAAGPGRSVAPAKRRNSATPRS